MCLVDPIQQPAIDPPIVIEIGAIEIRPLKFPEYSPASAISVGSKSHSEWHNIFLSLVTTLNSPISFVRCRTLLASRHIIAMRSTNSVLALVEVKLV